MFMHMSIRMSAHISMPMHKSIRMSINMFNHVSNHRWVTPLTLKNQKKLYMIVEAVGAWQYIK